MKNEFIKSSPHFFRLISQSIYALVLTLFVFAAFIPAPLQEHANPAITPNPAKSAWFLLWIQEMVSWSRLMIYPVMILGCLFVLLPWLPVGPHIHKASWFPSSQNKVSFITILLGVVFVALTIFAMFFRGANWSFVY